MYPLKEHFKVQGWMYFFNILNGPTYPYLVNDFQVRDEVYNEVGASFEERGKIAEDKVNKGKSRTEMGLREFKKGKIRLVVMGVDVTITQRDIAKLICVSSEGRCFLNTKDGSKYFTMMKSNLFDKSNDFRKVKNMKTPYKLLFKILIGCMVLREGSSDKISQDHKYFTQFLVIHERLNLIAYTFNHLYDAIKESQKNNKKSVPYARLLYELFHQSRLIDALKKVSATQDLEEIHGNIFSATIFGNMNINKKKYMVKPEASICIRSVNTAYIDDFYIFSSWTNLK